MNKIEFKALFDEYYDPIKNYIYYKVGDIELTDDLVQVVFMRCWEKRDSILMDTAKSYLYKIATNLVIDHSTKKKKVIHFEVHERDKVSIENPHNLLESDEFATELQEAISALTENQREVFLMNRIDSLTYKEIAHRLSISEKAVEKRMRNAIYELKNKLGRKL